MARHDAEGLLARWSRRKAAARAGAPEPEAEATEEQRPTPQAGQPEHPPALAATDAPDAVPELPDPDTLEAPADFKQFMREGVPPDLRRRALRRLWRLDPAYNRLDGLDDYCEDYTDQARVVQGLRTAYRVGRGFLEELVPPDQPSAPAAGSAPEPAPSIAAATSDAASAAPAESHRSVQAADAPSIGVEPADEVPATTMLDRGHAGSGSRKCEPARARPVPRRS